jgi:hypothetical protein
MNRLSAMKQAVGLKAAAVSESLAVEPKGRRHDGG